PESSRARAVGYIVPCGCLFLACRIPAPRLVIRQHLETSSATLVRPVVLAHRIYLCVFLFQETQRRQLAKLELLPPGLQLRQLEIVRQRLCLFSFLFQLAPFRARSTIPEQRERLGRLSLPRRQLSVAGLSSNPE